MTLPTSDVTSIGLGGSYHQIQVADLDDRLDVGTNLGGEQHRDSPQLVDPVANRRSQANIVSGQVKVEQYVNATHL
jgi:hypothetical protein